MTDEGTKATAQRGTHPVVVAVDGTSGCDGALRHAVAVASRRGVALRVVHVAPDTVSAVPYVPYPLPAELTTAARKLLDEAFATARGLDPELDVWPVLRHGGRVGALVEASHEAQLLVLGRESVHGLDRILLGRTTVPVAVHATPAVRVVPAAWTERPGPVVVGLRHPQDATAELGMACDLASRRGGRVVLVHAVHLPSPYAEMVEGWGALDDWLTSARRAMEAQVDVVRRRRPDVEVEVRVDYGDPANVLLVAAVDLDASLVLVTRHRHGGVLPGTGSHTLGHLLSQTPTVVHVAPAGRR